jgi:transcription elongation factor Elf1
VKSGTRRYARTVEEGRSFRDAVNTYLVCPACGECCLAVQKSASAIVMRCETCKLRFHCRRSDLAASVRIRAERTSTGDQKQAYWNLADLLDELPDRARQAPARHGFRDDGTWQDPSLVE